MPLRMQTPRYIFKTCLIRRICLPRLIVPPPARSGPALLSRSTILAASVLLGRLIIVYERKRWAFTVAFEIAPEYQENPRSVRRSLASISADARFSRDFRHDETRPRISILRADRSGPKRIEALKAALAVYPFPFKVLVNGHIMSTAERNTVGLCHRDGWISRDKESARARNKGGGDGANGVRRDAEPSNGTVLTSCLS